MTEISKAWSVGNKPNEVVSILDYSIFPDGDLLGGGTDYSALMQEALNDAAAANLPLSLASDVGTGIITLLSGINFNDNQIIIGSSYENCILDGRHTGNVLSPLDPTGSYRGLRFQDFQITKSDNAGTGRGLYISNSRSGTILRVEVNSCDIGMVLDTQANANFSYFNSFIDCISFNNTTNALKIMATGTDIPNANFITRGDYRGGVDTIRIIDGVGNRLTDVSIQGGTSNWLHTDVDFHCTDCRFENSSSDILTNGGITASEGVKGVILGGTMLKGVLICDPDAVRVTGLLLEDTYPELGRELADRTLRNVAQSSGFRSGKMSNLLLRSKQPNNAAWTQTGTISFTTGFSDPQGQANSAYKVAFDTTANSTSNYHQEADDNSVEGVQGYYFTFEARALTSAESAGSRDEAGSVELRFKQLDAGSSVVQRIDVKVYLDSEWSTQGIFMRFDAATVSGGAIDVGIYSIENTGDLANIIVSDHSFVIGDLPGIITTTVVVATSNNLGTNTTGEVASEFLSVDDGITAPGAGSTKARIYVDSSDGDLKVVFANGFVAVIAADS